MVGLSDVWIAYDCWLLVIPLHTPLPGVFCTRGLQHAAPALPSSRCRIAVTPSCLSAPLHGLGCRVLIHMLLLLWACENWDAVLLVQHDFGVTCNQSLPPPPHLSFLEQQRAWSYGCVLVQTCGTGPQHTHRLDDVLIQRFSVLMSSCDAAAICNGQ